MFNIPTLGISSEEVKKLSTCNLLVIKTGPFKNHKRFKVENRNHFHEIPFNHHLNKIVMFL